MQPWYLFLLTMVGCMTREQQLAIEYLQTENNILRDKIGNKRVLLDDNERRRLAVKGKQLGRKLLSELEAIFTPDTILRWHRELIARKWDYSSKKKRVGRPRIRQEIVEQIPYRKKTQPNSKHCKSRGL
ncbi:hypothetical protein Pla110_42580 [Polystyrenella longa]|uniref:Transposase n=1 Tax=Polystyrenella longa TaxID=2528007 RepID=A0A518CTE0_9PLAN|nr:hypothetical protein [Polystyrenella longa]QDU82500.1 hypothetical protein Pla110_42580 [Polystyrenella longa]